MKDAKTYTQDPWAYNETPAPATAYGNPADDDVSDGVDSPIDTGFDQDTSWNAYDLPNGGSPAPYDRHII